MSLIASFCTFIVSCGSTPSPSQSEAAVSNYSIHNAYPELPEINFKRTTVTLDKVESYLKQTDYSIPVKIACYAIFKTESANGKKGINNNYIGYQADGDRVHEEWTKYFVGTVIRRESMTGRNRRFLAFSKWEDCVDILLMRISERGLYVGGNARQFAKMKITSDRDWPTAYYKGWVLGDSNAKVPKDKYNYYLKLYKKAKELFR